MMQRAFSDLSGPKVLLLAFEANHIGRLAELTSGRSEEGDG